MEKNILVYSYWLGLLCLAIAVLWKAANVFGFFAAPTRLAFGYMSFFKGALLFFLAAIATAQFVKAKS